MSSPPFDECQNNYFTLVAVRINVINTITVIYCHGEMHSANMVQGRETGWGRRQEASRPVEGRKKKLL